MKHVKKISLNSKRKRWKKGQSSSSNPETNRFREAAKSRFFNRDVGTSGLTVEALAKHDKVTLDKDGDVDTREGDQESQHAKTVNTWATNWTDCTNVTFGKLHRYWASNSAIHREILAVLAAVTDVIKTNGGTESDTEYFAAFMTALESAENSESTTAIIYLLSVVLKRVPTAVLRNKFSTVAKMLMDLLAKNASGDCPSLAKSLLKCLALLLRVQDQSSWNMSSTQNVYSSVLTFIAHKKPKVRKSSHEAIRLILKGSLFMNDDSPPSHHPAASLTARYCIKYIEESGGTGDSPNTLHVLGLLKDILGTFPQNHIKTTCETILKVMTLSNVMLRSHGMQALHGLFLSGPKSTSLSSDLCAKIITALYDYKPSESDVQPMIAWVTVMEKAHVCLTRLDEKLCISFLPRVFSAGMSCMLTEKQEIIVVVTRTLKALINECLQPVSSRVKALVKNTEGTTSIHKIIIALESGLSYQFHASWSHVLQLFGDLYLVLGAECPEILQKSLQSIADLRSSHNFPYKGEVDHVIGCAVKAIGPKGLLEAIPLQITGEGDDYSFPRSWLMPVLRNNIQDTELSFFTLYFLPLAAKLREKSSEFAKEKNMVVSKSYEALQGQIWSLLPGFCTRPTDLTKSFKGIAKILGTAVTDRPDLRMCVMSSIRKLIAHNVDHDENRKELARFAKNFIPIFLNIFTIKPDNPKDLERLSVLETIKVYLKISDPELIETFFGKLMDKIRDEKTGSFERIALLDIGISLIPYLSSTDVSKLYDVAINNLDESDKTLQKKSYRIFEEIFSQDSVTCKDFVKNHLNKIQKVLLDSLSSSSPSSKTPRLRCLIHLCRQLTELDEEFLAAVAPEATLCTKEIGERARQSAYSLLVAMGEMMIRCHPGTEDESIFDFFQLVMAGLAGPPTMVSGTILALTRMLYEYKEKISSKLLDCLMENMYLLLKSKSREIVQSALGFLKVLLSAISVVNLAVHTQSIVKSLVGLTEDSKHHFRFKTKVIYAKLIKKFGYEMIHKMCPASVHKILANIRKTDERAKKKKKEEEDISDDDDEEQFKSRPEDIDELLRDSDSELEEDTREKKSKKTKKASKAWLKEEENEIVDFMDTDASKNVMATKPGEKRKAKTGERDAGFKMAPDGRLIIKNDSDDEAGQMESEDENDIDELLEALEGGAGKPRQKKRKIEDLGSDDETSAPKPKYKAGGSGIHRDVSSKKTKHVAPGEEYRAKKAGGDIKRKGKPDPFAYVPLNMKSLNKRKQAKVKGQFKSFVKGAKKGALKGSKAKRKK